MRDPVQSDYPLPPTPLLSLTLSLSDVLKSKFLQPFSLIESPDGLAGKEIPITLLLEVGPAKRKRTLKLCSFCYCIIGYDGYSARLPSPGLF